MRAPHMHNSPGATDGLGDALGTLLRMGMRSSGVAPLVGETEQQWRVQGSLRTCCLVVAVLSWVQLHLSRVQLFPALHAVGQEQGSVPSQPHTENSLG